MHFQRRKPIHQIAKLRFAHFYEPCEPQIVWENRLFNLQQTTIFIKRHGRYLQDAPSSRPAVGRAFFQYWAGRAGRCKANVLPAVVDDLHPKFPMLRILNFIEEDISCSLYGIKGLVDGKDSLHIDEFYNRIVEGYIQDVFWIHALIDQAVHHLIHDRRLADTPCAGQNGKPPNRLMRNHSQCFVVGKPFLRLVFLFDCQRIAPPGIVLPQYLDNLLIAYDCHTSTSL